MSHHTHLTVFLSSTDTSEPTILAAIDQLSALLAQHQITLVYGASAFGLIRPFTAIPPRVCAKAQLYQ